MATTIPIYETERGNEGGDVKVIPEVADLNTVIDRLNDVTGGVAKVAASLVTGIVVDNNAILWTAVDDTVDGNSVTVAIVVPAGAGAALSVGVSGSDITVHSATGLAGVASSTATEVETAVAGNAAAAALVTAVDDSTSDGSGVVATAAKANLTGGTGYHDLSHPVAP